MGNSETLYHENKIFLGPVMIVIIYILTGFSLKCVGQGGYMHLMFESIQASYDLSRLTYNGESSFPPQDYLGAINEKIMFKYMDLLKGEKPSEYPQEDLMKNKQESFVSLPDQNCFSLSAGLEHVGKGSKQSLGDETTKTSLNYIELSITGDYNYLLNGGKEMIHAGLGPFIAMGISGRIKSKGQGQSISAPVKFGRNGDFNRMDYGISINGGYSFAKRWDVSLGYDLGMANIIGIAGNHDGGDKCHTKSFSLNIGYAFRLK